MAWDMTAAREILDAVLRVQQARTVTESERMLERLQAALAGSYRILDVIGCGGMATVYLAYELKLRRTVALKVPSAQITANPEKRERFLREARTVADLAHPNIVPIHAVEEAGEFVFFTMEYVDGVTLQKRVDVDGPLSVGEATRIIHDAARAIGFAHRKGIVHRDLKPDNIIIETGEKKGEPGRVMVMDFGIAQRPAAPDSAPQEIILGTPRFMSPEQVNGAPGDQRSDVYSLGVTAYFAVTGQHPFDGDTPEEVFFEHLNVAAPTLHVHGRNLDTTFSWAVARCLEKNPNARFADGHELAEELTNAPEIRRTGLPLALRAYVRRLDKFTRRGRGIFAIAGVAGLGFVGQGLVLGDWVLIGRTLGYLALLAVAAGIVVAYVTRRLFRQGYPRAKIIHALSVEVEREEELHLFVDGEAARHPGRRARKLGYRVGGVLLLLGLASSFAGVIDPFIGAAVMAAGALILGGSAVIGHWKIRKRGDLPRNLWLQFWRSRGGKWMARVAAFGLGDVISKAAAGGHDEAAMTRAALVRAERVRERLMMATQTLEIRNGNGGDEATEERRRRLEDSTAELDRRRARLVEVQAEGDGTRVIPEIEAVTRLCDVVDGWLLVNTL